MGEMETKRERGQGLVEYVLILTLVALVAIMVLVLLGPGIGRVFQNVQASIANGGAPAASQAALTATAVPTDTKTYFGTPIVTNTPQPSATGTPTPSATAVLSSTANATAVPSNTPAPSSTLAPSSTAIPGGPSSTPLPPNTPVPSSTPVPLNTLAPTSTLVPTSVPVASSTSAPAKATPLTGNILSASAARTGAGSANTLDVTVTVSGSTTLSLVDSVSGTLASNAACDRTCVIHISSIGKAAGYIAIVAASGGVLTVYYPAKG